MGTEVVSSVLDLGLVGGGVGELDGGGVERVRRAGGWRLRTLAR
jgi:hypothetical protein